VEIKEWPAVESQTAHGAKAPSQIAYEHDNTGNSGNCWGYQIKPGTARWAWMKLLLDQNAAVSQYDDPGLKEDLDRSMLKDGRKVKDVTADFFKELYHFTMKHLERDYPKILGLTPINFWFTMPAIWSDEAQIKTLSAAEKGGFGSRKGDEVSMITEPEAAALATLSSSNLGYGDDVAVSMPEKQGVRHN
jgi:hypothetical protein